MNNQEGNKQSAHELMSLHIDSLFTHDQSLRLHTINEPWPGNASAPRLFLGRTIEGTNICRFRYDVQDALVEQIEGLCADEPPTNDFQKEPKHFDKYMSLLQGKQFTMGPCFLIPIEATPSVEVVRITSDKNIELLQDGFEQMIPEVDDAQPFVAIVRENRTVSICRSVRITHRAHEAGLETLSSFRGRGYAAEAVAGWAKAVRQLGCTPLYSTSWDNLASQSVARKSSAVFYGASFTIT